MTVSSIKSRYLELKHDGDAFALRFVPKVELTAGSYRRGRQSIRLVRSELRRFAEKVETLDGGITARLVKVDVTELSEIIVRIDTKLDRLRKEKITIKMVEEILRLTALERLRWTKDGRLPANGNAYIQRGQKVRLWTYSPEVVARLWKNPDIIEGWRKQDLRQG